MSLSSVQTNTRNTKIKSKNVTKASIIGLAIIGTSAGILALTPTSGAWFFDEKKIDVTASTGAFSFDITSDDGTVNNDGRLELAYSGLVPGIDQGKAYTITNTGTTDGRLELYSSGIQTSGGTGDYDKSKMFIYVNDLDYEGGAKDLSHESQDTPFSLGVIHPGESAHFYVSAGLDQSAGSEWNNVTAQATITAKLSQIIM